MGRKGKALQKKKNNLGGGGERHGARELGRDSISTTAGWKGLPTKGKHPPNFAAE